MSLKDQAQDVLIKDWKTGGIILLPNNRWVPYHQLEHEYIHNNSIDSAFKNSINLNLDKWINCISDYGYGDITCNLNYWLWMNELRPIKIKILVDETHYNKEFGNKETTIDKIDFYIKEFCGSNIEYQYSTIRRSFGSMLRTYKSAFRGKSYMKHTEKTFRSMWHKYVPINLEQYWFVPLSMQLEWYPVKNEWKMPKEKKAVLYRYRPPKDWDLISRNSFENIGDKMISQDEKVVNKYWDDLETALQKEGYKVEYLTYKMAPKTICSKLQKATLCVSSRGGFSYLAQHIGTPTVSIYPPAETILNKNYNGQHVQFHNRCIRLFDPVEISKVDVDSLVERSTLEKSVAFYKKINYNTLEKMQRLEKDVQTFNSETAKCYRRELWKDSQPKEKVKVKSKSKAKTKSKK